VYRSQYFEGGRVLLAALSAIDIALYDVVGKALGVPVYQLLGGKQRDAVPCFATTGGDTVEQMIERVQMLVDLGWQCIRVGPAGRKPMMRSERGVSRPENAPSALEEDRLLFEPRESIGLTAQWLTKLREAVGPTPVLGIDYHHRLNVAETASFCQRMPSGTLDFLEEPIRDETPEAYEVLRTMTDVPFAIGEEFASKWQFLPYLERGITNFARIDVCNVGGLTESMKVASLAESHYIDLMPHNPLGPICTAATVHLAAAVPNFSWMEMRVSPGESGNRYDDEIFPSQLKLDGTVITVPDAPGLGIEVNEALIQAQQFKFWEAPHLHRRDGSVTNW
jgi:galactonate dehydratase